MSIAEEIEILIRARYPIIYIVTPEEARVHALLEKISQNRQKKLYQWSHAIGLIPAGTSIQSHKNRNPATRDPLAALEQVMEQVEPAIFVLNDFHPFLTRSHPAVVRKLKEIALHLKNSYKTIILVSPVQEIPVELQKEITVLNFPLPGRAELGELLDAIVEDLKQHRRVRIDLLDADREALLQAALGLTLTETENVIAKTIVREECLGPAVLQDVFSEKQQIIRKSGLLEYYAAVENFSDVGGLANLKGWLEKRATAFGEQARAFGLAAPKGILLLGVQGCGKSLCAKAVSNYWQLPLLRFDIGRMFGSFVGSSEENVRRAIAVAESIAPAILWVDEIDKAFSGSQSSGSADGGTAARVFGTFLTWLSEKSAPIFVVATANDITHLPAELLRKGRLDEIFFVDLPFEEERRQILAIHLQKRGRDIAFFDLDSLATATDGFSGAEIEEAINSALYDAFYQGTELGTDHVQAAVAQAVPLSRTMDEQISRLRSWAAGRARQASGGLG